MLSRIKKENFLMAKKFPLHKEVRNLSMAKPHFNKSVNVEAVGQLVEEDGELFILIDEDTNEKIPVLTLLNGLVDYEIVIKANSSLED